MTNVRLDRHLEHGALPLWFQIKERLRKAIQDGDYATGDQLPTELQLIELFKVSRTTVRAAVDKLADEGLVERTPGRGTFVRGRAVEQPVLALAGFHEDMRARGLAPAAETMVVDFTQAPSDVASALGLDAARVVIIERRMLADGKPMAFGRGYLPTWVLGEGPLFTRDELDSASQYQLMEERSEAYPQTAEETIGAVAADELVASLLEVKAGAPLLKARRVSFDRSGQPVECVDVWYRADRYRYRVDLARS